MALPHPLQGLLADGDFGLNFISTSNPELTDLPGQSTI
jgi:hypothetical protein